MSVSHDHGGGVYRVALHEFARRTLFVLHQVEQRVAHLLLVDTDQGRSHGENFHRVRCDPVSEA